MKWPVIVLLGFVVLLTACRSKPQAPPLPEGVHLQAAFNIPELVDGQQPSHAEMNYLLYLPKNYGQDEDKRWPLILFLHGSGDDENDSASVMSFGLPEVLHKRDQPNEFPFIVVSPQAFSNTPWWIDNTPAVLIALLEEVINTYRVDPNRVYLTGISMGGYGSWHLATAYPDRFAAMISISGSGYRTPTVAAQETLCALKDVPIWAIHGALDMISDPIASEMNMPALSDCGGEVKWTLYESAGHLEAYWQAYRDPELYTWLLEHSK